MQGRTAGACGLIAAAWLGRNDGWIPAKDVAAAYGLSAMCMFNTMGGLYCEDLNAALGDGLITVYNNSVYATSDTSHSQVYVDTYAGDSDSQDYILWRLEGSGCAALGRVTPGSAGG